MTTKKWWAVRIDHGLGGLEEIRREETGPYDLDPVRQTRHGVEVDAEDSKMTILYPWRRIMNITVGTSSE